MSELFTQLAKVFQRKKILSLPSPKKAIILTLVDDSKVYVDRFCVTHAAEYKGLSFPATEIWIDSGSANKIVVKHKIEDVVAWIQGHL